MTTARGPIVVATRNPGKLREFRRLLAGLRVPVLSLDEAGVRGTVDETGGTYEENATLKAAGYARDSRRIAIADDSGIEVDALGGAPGVKSAIYTGPGRSDAERTKCLLERLQGVPPERRTARYRAVVAVSGPDARPEAVRLFVGTCEGTVAETPRGENGFGYDPVFIVRGTGRTMAELADAEKDSVSHRGNAVRASLGYLASLVGRPV